MGCVYCIPNDEGRVELIQDLNNRLLGVGKRRCFDNKIYGSFFEFFNGKDPWDKIYEVKFNYCPMCGEKLDAIEL